MTEGRKQYYSGIEKEIMGSEFKFKVERVKDEQCRICTKRNKNNCRLEFEEDRCKNYIKRSK